MCYIYRSVIVYIYRDAASSWLYKMHTLTYTSFVMLTHERALTHLIVTMATRYESHGVTLSECVCNGRALAPLIRLFSHATSGIDGFLFRATIQDGKRWEMEALPLNIGTYQEAINAVS